MAKFVPKVMLFGPSNHLPRRINVLSYPESANNIPMAANMPRSKTNRNQSALRSIIDLPLEIDSLT